MLLIIGVLLLSALTPFRISQLLVIALVAALAALGMGRVFLGTPRFGLIALIITAVIIPSPPLPGGLNIAVLLLGGLVGLWLLGMVIRQRSLRLYNSRPVKALLIFVGVVILAFIVGQVAWYPTVQHAPLETQLGGLAIFVLAAGAFLLTAHQVHDLRWLELMVWVFLGLGALFIAGWLIPGIDPLTDALYQRGATANSIFWVWLTALAMSQALFNNTLKWPWRVLLWVLVLATLYVAFVINGEWKSGYLPAFVVVTVLVAVRSWKAAFVLVLAAPVLAIILSSQAISSDEYSYSTRVDALLIVLNIVKANPILGFGPANYYWYTPLFPIRGYYVQFNSHNQYIDILAQTGVIGLATLFWFFGELGALGWRLYRRVPSGFAKAYLCGALAGLVGTVAAGVLVDWFFPFVYNIGLNGFRGSIIGWLFLGGIVSIERLVHQQAQEQS